VADPPWIFVRKSSIFLGFSQLEKPPFSGRGLPHFTQEMESILSGVSEQNPLVISKSICYEIGIIKWIIGYAKWYT
jgi:hypothetical protein